MWAGGSICVGYSINRARENIRGLSPRDPLCVGCVLRAEPIRVTQVSLGSCSQGTSEASVCSRRSLVGRKRLLAVAIPKPPSHSGQSICPWRWSSQHHDPHFQACVIQLLPVKQNQKKKKKLKEMGSQWPNSFFFCGL